MYVNKDIGIQKANGQMITRLINDSREDFS